MAISVGCSLIVDTSEIDGGCGEGRKVCGGRCVAVNNPVFGCSPVSGDCDACPQTPNAIVGCNPETNLCVTTACVYPFVGCDDPLDTCDVEILFDPLNCGGCGLECDDGERCSNMECCPAGGDGPCHAGRPRPLQ